ncbi:MAG: NUDIX domain-containing protein [Chloroflexi bacterium]|nr:NUDIX domain-containing protein [Chloroflexota bacterium]
MPTRSSSRCTPSTSGGCTAHRGGSGDSPPVGATGGACYAPGHVPATTRNPRSAACIATSPSPASSPTAGARRSTGTGSACGYPPGGHIEADEDPVQAVLREVREETGLAVEIIGAEAFAYRQPPQLPPPASMAVYDIPRDGQLAEPHQHIDLIYFTRPTSDAPALPDDGHAWTWVDEVTLRGGTPPTAPGARPRRGSPTMCVNSGSRRSRRSVARPPRGRSAEVVRT